MMEMLLIMGTIGWNLRYMYCATNRLSYAPVPLKEPAMYNCETQTGEKEQIIASLTQ